MPVKKRKGISKMTVENFVPPLELCQQIPESLQIRRLSGRRKPREQNSGTWPTPREGLLFLPQKLGERPSSLYPAPTLAEWVSRHGIKGGDKDEYLRVLMKI